MKIFFCAALAFLFLALVKAVKVNDLVIYHEYPLSFENYRRYGIVQSVEEVDGLTNVTAKIFLDNKFLDAALPLGANNLTPLLDHVDAYFNTVQDEELRFHVITEAEWSYNFAAPAFYPVNSMASIAIPSKAFDSAPKTHVLSTFARELMKRQPGKISEQKMDVETYLINVLMNQEFTLSAFTEFPQNQFY